MSKLGDILQEEALAEINSILAEADSKAEALIADAKSKASERLEACRRKVEAELRGASRRAESAAELILSTARIQTRGQAIALVKEKVLAGLEEIAGKPNYGKVLEALAEEARKAVGAPEAVVVHPDGEAKLHAWAVQKRLDLRTDPGLHLGVRIVAHGGQRSVENSLPERLKRAWESISSGVAQRLWGSPTSSSP
jgi:V/A-type H+-transporting ATPase subunit E